MTTTVRGRQRAKQEAKSVLRRFGEDVPVDVVSIAEAHGVDVRLEELEDADFGDARGARRSLHHRGERATSS